MGSLERATKTRKPNHKRLPTEQASFAKSLRIQVPVQHLLIRRAVPNGGFKVYGSVCTVCAGYQSTLHHNDVKNPPKGNGNPQQVTEPAIERNPAFEHRRKCSS